MVLSSIKTQGLVAKDRQTSLLNLNPSEISKLATRSACLWNKFFRFVKKKNQKDLLLGIFLLVKNEYDFQKGGHNIAHHVWPIFFNRKSIEGQIANWLELFQGVKKIK